MPEIQGIQGIGGGMPSMDQVQQAPAASQGAPEPQQAAAAPNIQDSVQLSGEQ